MSTKTKKQIEELAGQGDQLQLIVQIMSLVYQINQAKIAEAEVLHRPFFLHVVVKKYGFGGQELLNVPLGLAMPSDSGWPVMRLACDMRKAVATLEQILAAGHGLLGGAA